MVKTLSKMLPLGTKAPDFLLPDVVTEQTFRLRDQAGKRATLIMFLCNHCPFVKHVNAELARLARDYITQGIAFIAINSNDVEHYPDDAPEKMKSTALAEGYGFPYLFDETQEVAKAYQAACTPDFYLFDDNLQLVYRGQLDDSRPGNGIAVTGASLREAMNALLECRPLDFEQKPSMGCNIKWKAD